MWKERFCTSSVPLWDPAGVLGMTQPGHTGWIQGVPLGLAGPCEKFRHPLSWSLPHVQGRRLPDGVGWGGTGQTDLCRRRGSRTAAPMPRGSPWSRPSPASTTTRSHSGLPGIRCVTPAWPSPRRHPPRTTRSPPDPGCLRGMGLVGNHTTPSCSPRPL